MSTAIYYYYYHYYYNTLFLTNCFVKKIVLTAVLLVLNL
jgi:hypothetical protein